MADSNAERTRIAPAALLSGAWLGLGAYLALALVVLVYVGPQRDPVDLGAAEPSAFDASAEPRLISKITELDFGDLAVGARDERRFILFHDGASERPLTIYNTWIAEPDSPHFTTDFSGPVELDAGESLVLTVTFEPSTPGAWIAPLYVSHDGESGIEIFTMIGNGVDPDAADEPRERAINLGLRAKPNFGKSVLDGLSGIKPTSLQFGPDGKLYVSDMLGVIKVLDIKRNGANDYEVTSTETITLIRGIPNHDDDGDLAPNIKNRLVTGLLVAGTATDPVIYVASSDPRIGGGHSSTNTNLDTNSGVISRLTRSGNGWNKVDLVRGLSRSEENHHTNGMALDESTNRLYIAAGGNTNLGAPSKNFVELPEYALSAAILEIDLGQIGNQTYDLPTLDDDSRSGTKDKNDPFGGNNGKNQAKLVPGGPVQVYAPGFRNAYDLVLTDDGRMYTVDNGGNAGWGGKPKNCSNAISEPGVTYIDGLHFVDGEGYYGGHANPTRASQSNTYNKNKQSPVSVSNSIECVTKGTGENGSIASFGTSLNGLDEYRASNFDGDMQGDLLGAGFDNKIHHIKLNTKGDDILGQTTLFTNVGGTPLDVTTQADWQMFPGTIWVADFNKKNIVVFEPIDYDGSVIVACGTAPGNDDDNDGYSNADENANGTDPCSAADVPTDADGDGISNLTDDDDDNDGIADHLDPFALDPNNGRGTGIPLEYTWENNDTPPGYILNLGFSGLMNDGSTAWQDSYDLANLTAGGAAGVFTIDEVPDSDPVKDRNDQRYAFQFGIDVTPASAPFVVHTRVVAPFAGAILEPHQSLGLYIGTGDQDNYIKLVANTLGSDGGVQFASERNGVFTSDYSGPADVLDADHVDLFLRVDPAAGQVRAFVQSRMDGVDGPVLAAGGATALPTAWLTAETGLAVGIISTSTGATPFTATWDFMHIADTSIVDDAGTTGVTGGTSTAGSTTAGSTTGTTTAGSSEPAGVHATVDGLIVVEAERYRARTVTATHAWTPTTLGGAAAVTTANKGALASSNSGSPHVQYSIDVDQPGIWQVWVRASGDTNAAGEGKNDSVHIGLDGVLSTAAAMDDFPAGWNWSNSRRAPAPAILNISTTGQHTLDMWMREDGLVVDRILLSRLPEYVPVGTGPASTETDASADSGGGVTGGTNTDTGGSSTTGGTTDAGGSATTGGTDTSGSSTTGSGTDTSGNTSTGGSDTSGSATTGGSDTSGGTSTGGNSGGGNDGLLILEAEDADRVSAAGGHAWQLKTDTGASGGGLRHALPNTGALRSGTSQSPSLDFDVNFPDSGTWFIWVRGRGDTNASGEGKNDSLHVGLDGVLAGGAAIDNFPSEWTWSRSTRSSRTARLEVTNAGMHEVTVWMREDGIELDRILLTRDASYVPTGAGPDVDGGSDTSTTDGSTDGSTGGSTGGDGVTSVIDGVIAIDANDFTESLAAGGHSWQASGDGARKAQPNNGTLRSGVSQSPRLDYRVNFDQAGTWHVWVHGLGDQNAAGEGKNDSVHVGLNGQLTSASNIQGFPAQWTWSRTRRGGGLATLNVTAPGEHVLNVWMREDGFAFDQVVLIGPDADINEPGGETSTGNDGTTSNDNTSSTDVSVLPSATWRIENSANGSAVQARHEGSAVEFEGQLYVMGGRGSRAVSIFDPDTNQWTNGATPPIELHHFQPVVFDDRIWVIGAMTQTSSYPVEPSVANVYIYTPATNSWSKGATIPASRQRGSMGAAVYGDKIYLLGGNTKGHSGGAVDWFDEFDPMTGAWTTLASAPGKRDHAPIAVVGDKLVAAGGRASAYPNTFANTVGGVDVYDFTTGRWTTTSTIPTQRAGTMAVTVGEEVLVIGGETLANTSAHDTVEAYNVASAQWRTLDSLVTGRHGGGAALLKDGVYVASGSVSRGGGASNESTTYERLPVAR